MAEIVACQRINLPRLGIESSLIAGRRATNDRPGHDGITSEPDVWSLDPAMWRCELIVSAYSSMSLCHSLLYARKTFGPATSQSFTQSECVFNVAGHAAIRRSLPTIAVLPFHGTGDEAHLQKVFLAVMAISTWPTLLTAELTSATRLRGPCLGSYTKIAGQTHRLLWSR